MLFRSRETPDPITRIRTAVWPTRSWSRSFEYFKKRVLRLAGSPHAVALGVAIGVAVAFTPFLGFHILIALPIAYVLGGNLVAAALGTAFANPLTIPFIWTGSYRLGRFFVGGPTRFRSGGDVPANLAEKSLHAIWPVIKPMIVGSIPLGIAAGIIAYFIVLMATSGFRAMRRERLAAARQRSEGLSKPAPAEGA
ncbi:MAG TPA: DUF2062 domain-containing protein [Bauldia sp.]|nr:DUF2062 domain-containing protein [Bauldia sp.]